MEEYRALLTFDEASKIKKMSFSPLEMACYGFRAKNLVDCGIKSFTIENSGMWLHPPLVRPG
jgi:hypothetical protein